MHGPRRVTSLSTAERSALELLRTASMPVFAALAAFARGEGLLIQPSTAPFSGPDEARLLGCIAWAQRGLKAKDDEVAPPLRALLQDCAAELDARRQVLPYLAFQRLAFAQGTAASPGAVAAVERLAMTRGRKADVLALLKARGSMTARELTAAGVSRQYQSLLCKRGVLIRTPKGLQPAA